MAGRHRASRPSLSQRLGPLTVASRARPAAACGLTGLLAVALCAGTLAPPTAADHQVTVAQLDGPVPLRLADVGVSRDAGRSDLTLEAEAAAAQALAAAARALADAARAAEQQRMREQAAAQAAAPVPVAAIPVDPPGGTPEQNRELGRSMTLEYGWDEGQFDCLDSLYISESNWLTTAENPSSGAYGIPQSLPGAKMDSAGDDWRTNPATQIEWGLGYIDDRYGTPCSAWSFKRANNWY